jgi:hypothetical protein
LSTCSGNPRLGEHCDFTKEELDFIIDYVPRTELRVGREATAENFDTYED